MFKGAAEGARHRAIVTAHSSAFTHAPNAEAALMKKFGGGFFLCVFVLLFFFF